MIYINLNGKLETHWCPVECNKGGCKIQKWEIHLQYQSFVREKSKVIFSRFAWQSSLIVTSSKKSNKIYRWDYLEGTRTINRCFPTFSPCSKTKPFAKISFPNKSFFWYLKKFGYSWTSFCWIALSSFKHQFIEI